MDYFRVSKYNPAMQQGVDWTSIFDVGKYYNGKMFTLEMYKKIEKQYIDFVIEVVQISKIDKVKILYLENADSTPWKAGKQFDIGQISSFIQDCLEERCWGQFIADQLIWECGYDFYMHIGTYLCIDQIRCIASKHELFVENWDEIKCLNNSKT